VRQVCRPPEVISRCTVRKI